jgi:hypothetical protein
MNSNYRIAATLYTLATMFVNTLYKKRLIIIIIIIMDVGLKICINTLHKKILIIIIIIITDVGLKISILRTTIEYIPLGSPCLTSMLSL